MSLHCATHDFCNLIKMRVWGREQGKELDCIDRALLREIPVPEALDKRIHHEEGEELAMKAFFSQELPFGTYYALATWDG